VQHTPVQTHAATSCANTRPRREPLGGSDTFRRNQAELGAGTEERARLESKLRRLEEQLWSTYVGVETSDGLRRRKRAKRALEATRKKLDGVNARCQLASHELASLMPRLDFSCEPPTDLAMPLSSKLFRESMRRAAAGAAPAHMPGLSLLLAPAALCDCWPVSL